jgi:transposase-like protein
MEMKRTRHTPEQIVRKLREADRLLAESLPLAEVMRHLEISHQTYQRWRSQYGAMRPDDMARLKMLEQENARLKWLLAEKDLDNDMLRMTPKAFQKTAFRVPNIH